MDLRRVGCVLALLLVCSGLLVTIAGAQTDYDIEITESTGVTLIDAPQSVSIAGDNRLALVEPGAELTADVTGPSDDEYDVYLRDNKANIVDWFSLGVEGSQTVSLSTDSSAFDPGTYAVTSEQNEIEAVSPVVIKAYDVRTDSAEEASQTEFEVSTELESTGDETPIDSVTLVAWDGDTGERFEMSAAEDSENTYTASPAELSPGEYQFQVIVYGEEEISDSIIQDIEDEVGEDIQNEKRNELIGLSDRWTATITESDDETSGGSGPSGGAPSGPGAPGSTPSDSPSDTQNGSDTGDPAPQTSLSMEITDVAPDTAGTTVAFDRSAINSIRFSADNANGTVTVDDYGNATPPNAPDLGDRPVLTGLEIDVPVDRANQSATIRITVNGSHFGDLGVDPNDTRVLRATNGSYETLDTTVIDANGSNVTIEAETPGFSVFVVSTDGASSNENPTDTPADGTPTENGTPTPNDSVIEPSDDEETPTGTATTDEPPEDSPIESQPGFGALHVLLALLACVGILRSR